MTMSIPSNNGNELRSITEETIRSKAKVLSNEGIIATITTIFIVTVAITIGILVIACNHGIGLGPLTGIGALGNTAAYSLLAGSAILLTVTTLIILVKLNNRVNHLAKEADDRGTTDLQAQLEDAKETSERAEIRLKELQENPSITIDGQVWSSEELTPLLENYAKLLNSTTKLKEDLIQQKAQYQELSQNPFIIVNDNTWTSEDIAQILNERDENQNQSTLLIDELEMVNRELAMTKVENEDLKEQQASITLNDITWTAETLSEQLDSDKTIIANLIEELEQVRSTPEKDKGKSEPKKHTLKKKNTPNSRHRSNNNPAPLNNNSTPLYPNLTLEGNNFNPTQAKRTEKTFNVADKLNQACIYSSKNDADINLSGAAFDLNLLSFEGLSKKDRERFESKTGEKISKLDRLKERILRGIPKVQKEQNAAEKNRIADTLLQKNKELTQILDSLSEYTSVEKLFSKS
ncbi:MAG: hypothetical protein S4CHLAM123_11920 [Chlamydiales bacterium]|nr:hypothetical protein [Chlamydiales bacterium]